MSRFRTSRLAAAILVAVGSLGLAAPPASAEPASMTGTVRDEATGLPIASACVNVYASDSFTYVGGACTDAAGSFTVPGLDSAATYKVAVSPPFEGLLLSEWYPDAPDYGAATAISPGDIDVRLAQGGKLGGTLAAADGAPAEGYFIHVWKGDLSRTVTGGSTWQGRWDGFVPVPPGEYKIEFSKPGSVSSWAYGKPSGTTADTVTVMAGQTTIVDDTIPAAPPGSTITGRVIDEETLDPVQACVSAVPVGSFPPVEQFCTTPSGEFAFHGLDPSASYRLQANDYFNVDYLSEWYDNARSQDAATAVPVGSDVTIGLRMGGRATGYLTQPHGTAAAGYAVRLIPTSDPSSAGVPATTDPEGWWHTFEAIEPGDYFVEFRDRQGATSYAYGATNREDATVIRIDRGARVEVNDRFAVPPRGSITGSVIDADTKAPLDGICVSAFPVGQTWIRTGNACTDNTGIFRLDNVPVGEWALAYSDPNAAYATRFSGGSFRPSRAEAVSVTEQAVSTAAPLKMRKGGSLVGTLVGGDGAPEAGVCPAAYFGRSDDYADDQVVECTNEHGEWSISGLAPKRYTVAVSRGWSDPHATTWAPSASLQRDGAVFEVESGETVDAGRITRLMGGVVTGVVTDEVTGQPLEGAVIDLDGFHSSGSGGGAEGPYSAQTDAQGRYTIVGVSPGSYRPIAFAGDTYAAEWNGDAADPNDAKRIHIEPATPTNLDFALAPGGTIDGTVSHGSNPPEWTQVDAYTATTGRLVGYGSAVLEEDGSFSVRGLPTGEFKLKFLVSHEGETVEQWYGGDSLASATRINVTSGETTTITVDLE